MPTFPELLTYNPVELLSSSKFVIPTTCKLAVETSVPIPTLPYKLTVPFTVNVAVPVDIPIPTIPSLSI